MVKLSKIEGTIVFAGLYTRDYRRCPRVDRISTSFGFEFIVQTFTTTYLLACSLWASHIVK
jgi:hypothetical protein